MFNYYLFKEPEEKKPNQSNQNECLMFIEQLMQLVAMDESETFVVVDHEQNPF